MPTDLLTCSTDRLRWMLSKAGMDSGPAYMINGILMALLWLLLRIIFCGWGLVSPASYQLLELSAPRAISMYVDLRRLFAPAAATQHFTLDTSHLTQRRLPSTSH